MRYDFDAIPERPAFRAGGIRLLARLHRDIALAAVAAEFVLPAQDFGMELEEAIERGSFYLVSETLAPLAS